MLYFSLVQHKGVQVKDKTNLIGQVFGKLTVVEKVTEKEVNGKLKQGTWWKCKCSCGGEAIPEHYALIRQVRMCLSCPTNEFKNEWMGKIISSKNYGDFKVIDVKDSRVTVQFIKTGFTATTGLKEVRYGRIKDPYYPSVGGVGFFGVGEYECTFYNKSGKKQNTPEYEIWNGMLKRCCNTEWRDKQNRLSYEDVVVCKEWHNFQNFAKWYTENKPSGEYDLDKDLKIIGNREYSPQACTFVPARVNALFTGTKDDRDLPRGVHFCNNKKKYVVQLQKGELTASGNPKQSHLGAYSDKEEAIAVYRKAKIELVSKVADEYKDVLDPVVYQNLKTRVLEFI